jgi:Gas vesicle protein K/Gas vesicle protein
MTQPTYRSIGDSSLIDLLDRLLETGVVATGDVVLGLADVDLARINLQLVLSTVDALMADDSGDVAALPTGAPPTPTSTPTSAATSAAPPAAEHPADPAKSTDGVASQRAGSARPEPPGSQSDPNLGGRSTPGSRTTDSPPQLPDRDRSDLGIGGLLVAVIEIVHRLLERQAIHRMERGSLTNDQIERLGEALMALDQRVNQLIEIFGTRSAPALPVTVAGIAH